MDRKFPCTHCGACCMNVGQMVNHFRVRPNNDYPAQLLADFPFDFDESGKCEKYHVGTGCTVYEDRPLICRSSEMFDQHYSKFMTEEQYLKTYADACNVFMALKGITDPEKKVVI